MTFKEWREVLDIIERHTAAESPIAAAEHGEIYINLSLADVPEKSIDGKRLTEIGFSPDDYSESWRVYV